jgi:hypothetical protein
VPHSTIHHYLKQAAHYRQLQGTLKKEVADAWRQYHNQLTPSVNASTPTPAQAKALLAEHKTMLQTYQADQYRVAGVALSMQWHYVKQAQALLAAQRLKN